MRHVQRVGGLHAHPLSEILVVRQDRWVVASSCQTLSLDFGREIKQLDAVDQRGELSRDSRAHGGLPSTAGAGYQEQHASDYRKGLARLPRTS